MKLTCSQQDILNAVQTAQKVTGKNPSLLYQYALLRAENNTAKVIGICGEETVVVSIDADVEESGEILVPTSLFREILAKMPDVQINIDINKDNIMKVNYINMKFTIQCLSSTGFTFTENINEDVSFSINTALFKTAIKQTYFTSVIQENRPVLAGIQMKAENGVLSFVSTDATRIAFRKVNIESNISFEIIIPARLVFEIINSPDKYNHENTVITFNSKYIRINTGNTTVITGLISGKFVNYQSIIPTLYTTRIISERTMFLSILERASLLSDESLYTVRFDINYSKLYVSSNNDHGNGYEEIDITTDGSPLTIAFNSKNFIEILKNMECDMVVFEFSSGTRICKITPAQNEELFYLIFPIRI